MHIVETLKSWLHRFEYRRRFRAFIDGYSYGYELYLSMRRVHGGKNERASLKIVDLPRRFVFFKPWWADAWSDGLHEGWSDADGDWLTSFSVKEMERARNEYSIKEEQEMLRAKFDDLYS